ncbi:hypothetical protein E2C01_008278 [Portunus trituberculatus]|uniref:Uncharacterized protein n=1 Tax=Portunus trituberculatus TaxID=210409 RepID=A0A5B7D4B2_PORTR|nr:hypothetical protein [Portunus trituberculatus]
MREGKESEKEGKSKDEGRKGQTSDLFSYSLIPASLPMASLSTADSRVLLIRKPDLHSSPPVATFSAHSTYPSQSNPLITTASHLPIHNYFQFILSFLPCPATYTLSSAHCPVLLPPPPLLITPHHHSPLTNPPTYSCPSTSEKKS